MKAGTKVFARSYEGSYELVSGKIVSGPHYVGAGMTSRGQESYIVEFKGHRGKAFIMVPSAQVIKQ